jgi:glycosyltransferase involved in cell wall biosynthesis
MIKVLHIFGKMVRGGSELRTVELMPLLSEKGVHFDFCTLLLGKGPLDEKIRQLGGEVSCCPLRPGLLTFGQRFARLLRQSDYDIVHSHTHYFSGNIVRLAHKAGIKRRIVHFRNTYDGKTLTLRRKLYCKIMHRWIDKHATAILAVCRGAMEISWERGWQKDPRAQVIYNGLDLSLYQFSGDERRSVVSEFDLPDSSKIIIHVGRMHRQKGQDVLLDSAAKVIAADPTIHFLLVGGGALQTAMQDKARTLNITSNVHFAGVRSDVPRLLKASDCFVLPSRWEGLPGAVLEAIAANLPVIATDLPGVREIAEHTDLICLVPIGDRDALCEKILKTVEELDSQPHIKRPFPVEFDLRRCAERLFKVYSC